MSRILLVFPTPFEAAKVFSLFAGRRARPKVGESALCEVGQVEFCALVCGYACECAAKRVEAAVESFKPQTVLLCGYCGACRASLARGDLLFDTEDAALSALLESVGAQKGGIFSTPAVAAALQKAQIFEETASDGVDMEGALVREIARRFGCAYANVRMVSDSAEDKVPAEYLNAYIDFESGDGCACSRDAMKVLLRKPSMVVELIKFAAGANAVRKKFDVFMERLVFELAGGAP